MKHFRGRLFSREYTRMRPNSGWLFPPNPTRLVEPACVGPFASRTSPSGGGYSRLIPLTITHAQSHTLDICTETRFSVQVSVSPNRRYVPFKHISYPKTHTLPISWYLPKLFHTSPALHTCSSSSLPFCRAALHISLLHNT